MINNQDFDKVCCLAKITIPENYKEKFLAKLNSVFDWIGQLQKIDTSSVDKVSLLDDEAVTERADIPILQNTKDEVLSNTKDKKFGMFCVPKIVE